MNAIFLPFRGIDYVFYTKHKVQTRGDNESMTAIMRSIGFDYPPAYWRGRGTLVEVGDPKVLNGKVWRFFTGVHESYGGSYTPYEDCKEYYI